jgi:hypothetical protein
MKNLQGFLSCSYIAVIVLFFFYSFTQIDLGLTISRVEFFQNIVRLFQHIGYFNRSLSTGIYLVLLILMYLFYLIFLYNVAKKKVTEQFIWKVIIISSVILAFSYNAFSYDLFNYIFDAKIITHYHQNPYLKTALDYPNDPMLSFMHWTHRVFPYAPFWLVLTVPLSFVGLQLFLPTFFLFKFLMLGSFLGSLYFAEKILKKLTPEKKLFGLTFLGLNPLLLIESLVSAHLDIVMMFFALWSFYLLINKKYIVAWVLFILSIGIKFASGFLLPVFILVPLMHKYKKLSWEVIFSLALILLSLTVIVASMRTNFQPWYLIVPLTFTGFLAYRYVVFLPTVILSFGAMLTYVPFLSLGNWDKPVPQILSTIYIITCILSVIAVGVKSRLASSKSDII